MRIRAMRWLCVPVGMAMCAVASADPLATDRPDFVESSQVVGTGRVQIETSIGLERDSPDEGTARAFSTPTLLRVGVGERLELRLETDGRMVVDVDTPDGEETVRGWADLSFGFKMQMGQNEGARPSLAMLVHVDVDSGSSEFRGQDLRPSARVVAEWELPSDFSFGVMPGVVYDKSDEGRFISGIAAAVIGKQFTDKFRGFLEVAGQQIAHTEDGGCIVTYDAGVAYLVTDDLQLDTAVARAANSNTPDWGFVLGLSARF